MASQASVRNGNPLDIGPAPEGVFGSLAEFANDVATLGELQARLTAIDARESASRAVTPLVMLGVGGLLLLAALPVALLGAADLLARALDWPAGVAMLAVAGISLLLAGILAFLALRWLPRSFEAFRRSGEELTRNVNWIRTVIVHSGRPRPRPRP